MVSEEWKDKIAVFRKNEITEYFIYKKLASCVKDPHNREVLGKIAEEELKHYNLWAKYAPGDVQPDKFKIWKYFLIAKLFGVTFGIKLMEKGENKVQEHYAGLSEQIPEASEIKDDEERHENELIEMMDEEKLRYVGSIVLGLNDALVELTGALAGFTLALQNSRLIAATGLITGIAASFSMAASEYISTKSEEEESFKDPVKASVYTGFAYVVTVLFLVFPFLVLNNVFFALGLTLFAAVFIIFVFNFYVSVAKNINFRSRFLEMAGLSLGIAALTFGIGFLVRKFLGVEI